MQAPEQPTPAEDARRDRRPPRLRTPYPDYDVLAKWRSPSWNDQTRKVVAKRLEQVPERRFFTEAEWDLVEALSARLMPQTDRAEPIPITPFIDAKLAGDVGDGYRFESMPAQADAWRRGLAAIDAEAKARHGAGLVALEPEQQDRVLEHIDAEDVQAEAWRGLPPRRFFRHLLLNAVASVYYAHPDAWSEIGFGGPASPRGYVRLDKRDPWEAKAARD